MEERLRLERTGVEGRLLRKGVVFGKDSLGHRFYDLPSLTALTAFEASARHRSFKIASAELNVTPGAINRQIKLLEEELGVPLFVRVADGIELTADAEELYAVLSNGFSRAGQVVRRIKSVKTAKHVTLACRAERRALAPALRAIVADDPDERGVERRVRPPPERR